MNNLRTVVFIDDDDEDLLFFEDAYREVGINHPLKLFKDSLEALEYLNRPSTNPFMIISDVNMPRLNGFQLRQKVFENDELKMKCFPYLFLSTSSDPQIIQTAYDKSIQGFFVKPNNYKDLKILLSDIYNYWKQAERVEPA